MKKPVIGILTGVSELEYKDKKITQFYVFNDYNTAVLKFGGIPIAIMPSKQLDYKKTNKEDITPLSEEEKNILDDMLSLCDGFIMPGEDRSFEHNYYIDSYLKNHNIPTLGICLGMQVMAINSSKEKLVKIENDDHFRKNHKVKIEGTLLKSIIQKDEIIVNSYHSYKTQNVGEYTIAAKTSDGVIEAIEDNSKLFRLGVQWHPEKDLEDENNQKIFKSFINASLEYSRKNK